MQDNTLLAGYARRSILPGNAVPLGGYGNTSRRMSTGALDVIYATCIAFSQGENTLLLFTQDLIKAIPSWVSAVRERISPKTGVPAERIMVCATHTHSAPDTLSDLPCMAEYQKLYLDAMEEAALSALDDRAPVEMHGARATVPMNFVRHYLLANGTYAGPNFGDFDSAPIVDHAAKNDPEMLLVKLVREEKPDILIVNYQVHPTATSADPQNRTDISADFISAVRDNVEASTGMQFAYFTGAAGNQVVTSRIASERDHQPYLDYNAFGGASKQVYGWRMAQCILQALPSMEKLLGRGMESVQLTFEQPLNHDDEAYLEQAEQVVKVWYGQDREAGNKLAHSLGLSSVYHAGAITGRVKRPPTGKMELNAMRIGPLAFVTLPYEVFAAHGVYIKEHSPFPMTMVFSCANGAWSYVPTKEAYEYGCYESYVSYFAKGSGETVAQKLVEMLTQLR